MILLFICANIVATTLHKQEPVGIPYSKLVAKGYEELNGKKFAEAEKSFKSALDIYDQDGLVWLSYGQSAAKANDLDTAISAEMKVLEFGAFAPTVKASALFELSCAYCQKKDYKLSWNYLEQAMTAGYRSLDNIRKEPRIEPLHQNPGWEKLSATKDLSKATREEGWKYDLWFIDRELRRIHYAPYRYVKEKERMDWVKKISDKIPSLNDDQIMVELMRYVTSFGDGHTRLSVPNIVRPQLQFFLFKEGIYVTAAHPDQKALVGKKLVKVEGRPVETLYPLVEPLISRDNTQGIKSLLPNYVTNPAILNGLGIKTSREKINLTFEDADGKQDEIAVPNFSDFLPKPDWTVLAKASDILALKNRTKNYWFEYLPDIKAMYFQYNAIQENKDESIAKFTERMFKEYDADKAEKLIIDVRWNGGGNTFLSQPLILNILQRPKIAQEGGLYVIIGRNTFSAAQNFTTDIFRSCQPTFVGEATGSRPNFIGESIPYSLPYSKMNGTVSDLYWQRSWPMDDRMWIAPDLPAVPSITAFLAGKDPAMETIMAHIKD